MKRIGSSRSVHDESKSTLKNSDRKFNDKVIPAHRKKNAKVKFRCDFSSTIVDVMRDRGWWQVGEDDNNWDLFWCEVTQLKATLQTRRLNPHQHVPHFAYHYELTRKNLLARNLKRLKRLHIREGRIEDAELCDCMPLTYELPNEYLMFVEEYRKQPGATWIAKPAHGRQGKGIFLFQRLKDLMDWRTPRDSFGINPPKTSNINTNNEQENEPSPADLYVVQRYIENPYLLAGRKFDLRIYVLVTSFKPLKVWLAREGFARLSGSMFSLEKIKDNTVHLTNMAVQLKSIKEGTSPTDYKWSMRHLREFLTARHGVEVVESLVQNIAKVVMTSLHSVKQVILHSNHCFELYGYDILLDKALTPWLLEVNASPCLSATDTADYRLKYNLVTDVLNVLDLEGQLRGTERRVGGFDMLWNDGPVWMACPGSTDCYGRLHFKVECNKLNTYLGCTNDREKQLQNLKEMALALKKRPSTSHE